MNCRCHEPGETLAGELLGISPAMRALRDAVARAAGSAFPLLIEGESGTGKELVARAMHRLSARRDRWAAVNCAALTDELVETELFGHSRGAFTGAVGPRAGLFEEAHGGTLFLDEVANCRRGPRPSCSGSAGGRSPAGGGERFAARGRPAVTATNRSLPMLAPGVFREDLLFRLAVSYSLPPLRDRTEDVPLLAHRSGEPWRRRDTRASRSGRDGGALPRTWPGNVRELQNAIAALPSWALRRPC